MKTTLAIAAGLLLATATTSAFAQPYYGGRNYAAPSQYGEYVRQMRACQREARLHAELGQVHQDEHYQGLESRGDHRDLHDELEGAHDQYHYDNPRADLCNRYMQPNRYAPRYGFGYSQDRYGGNGYGGNGYGGYNNGYGDYNGYGR